MIEIENIKKSFGEVTVVDIPSLTVPKGESFGLVGNNGAGKTTLFRMIIDLLEPDNGNVMLNGKPVKRREEWKQFTGSYLDEGFLIDFLTPEEYFAFVAKLHNIPKETLDEKLEGFMDFFNGEIMGRKKYIRDLSKGNQKKVGVVAALLSEPELLILDEPFASLDPRTQIQLKNLLKELRDNQQMTMLISSHDLSHVTEVCERIVVLEKGQLVHDIKTDSDTLKELETYFAV